MATPQMYIMLQENHRNFVSFCNRRMKKITAMELRYFISFDENLYKLSHLQTYEY